MVKCHFCGKEIEQPTAYCKSNKYYCNKAEYELGRDFREKTKSLICEILNVERKAIYSANWAYVDNLEDQYTIIEVCAYLQSDYAPLCYALNKIKGQNVNSRFKYLLAAISNNLQSYIFVDDFVPKDKIYRNETCVDVVVHHKPRRRCLEEIESDDNQEGN